MPGGEPFLLRGGATACILIHGFTAMPEEMRPLGDDLAAAGHTVLGVRLAGHGTDPADLARTRWPDWIATVADAVALLAAERTILLGQSLGGMVALASAARLPVDGVVALNSPATIPRPQRRTLRVEPKPGVPADAELGLRRERSYPAYAGVPPRIEYEIHALSRDLDRTLPGTAVPALIVASRADPWVPHTESEHLAAALPQARLLVVDDLGHAITMDPGAAEVFAAIRDFVADAAAG